MRLTELNPRWIGHGEPCAGVLIGVSFDSPTNGFRLAVLFRNPIDPSCWLERTGMVMERAYGDGPLWERTGETFEALTLAPSINFHPSNWHGRICKGEVFSA